MNVTPNGFDPYNPFAVPSAPERPASHPTVTPAPGTSHADAEARSQGRTANNYEDIFSTEVPARTAPQVQRGDYTPPAIFVPPSSTSGDQIREATDAAKKQSADIYSGLGSRLRPADFMSKSTYTENKDILRGSARDAGEDFDPRTKQSPKGGQAGKARTQKKEATTNKPGSTITARGKIRHKPRLKATPPDGGVVTVSYVEPKPKKDKK